VIFVMTAALPPPSNQEYDKLVILGNPSLAWSLDHEE
jgi:hypothetical protein